MQPLFATARLYLREFTKDDSNLIGVLNSDPEVTKYVHDVTTTWAQSETLEKVILPQYRLYKFGRWAVFLKGTDEFIGWCGLKYRPEHNYIDLGYRFMKKYWGHGYATEAAAATLSYGFEQLGLQSIFAMAHVNNKASWQVLEKIGMQFIKYAFLDETPVRTYNVSAYDLEIHRQLGSQLLEA